MSAESNKKRFPVFEIGISHDTLLIALINALMSRRAIIIILKKKKKNFKSPRKKMNVQ